MIAFLAQDHRGETVWRRLIVPALATVLLAGNAVLAAMHYAVLLGVPPGDTAAWALPVSYAAVAATGLGGSCGPWPCRRLTPGTLGQRSASQGSALPTGAGP